MVLNIDILDIYLTHFLDIFLSAAEVCVQQGTGAVLLRQASAVLQSTTSQEYLCIFMATAYRLYLSCSCYTT